MALKGTLCRVTAPLVHTERLVLRLADAEAWPEVVRYYRENHGHLAPWSPSVGPEFFTEPYWREQAMLRRAEYESGLGARFLIFTKSAPERVIGNVALTGIHRFPAHTCLLGYGLAEEAVGHGFMSEAVAGAIGYAFNELNLHRVMANYMPHNRRSAAVLRRLGFTIEGYARDYLLIAGRWEDHILTALTNPDWRPAVS